VITIKDEFCSKPCVTGKKEVLALRESLLDVAGLSELFKALSDETRTKILYLLSKKELCVCDIAHLLEMSLPAISHHMRFLKVLRLVRSRKKGKFVFYALDDAHVLTLINQAREHFIERK